MFFDFKSIALYGLMAVSYASPVPFSSSAENALTKRIPYNAYTCPDGTTFTRDEVYNAVYKCQSNNDKKVSGYPKKFGNQKSENGQTIKVLTNVPDGTDLREFPLMKNKCYSGGQPGKYRVVTDYTGNGGYGTFRGVMQHTGPAVSNDFTACTVATKKEDKQEEKEEKKEDKKEEKEDKKDDKKDKKSRDVEVNADDEDLDIYYDAEDDTLTKRGDKEDKEDKKAAKKEGKKEKDGSGLLNVPWELIVRDDTTSDDADTPIYYATDANTEFEDAEEFDTNDNASTLVERGNKKKKVGSATCGSTTLSKDAVGAAFKAMKKLDDPTSGNGYPHYFGGGNAVFGTSKDLRSFPIMEDGSVWNYGTEPGSFRVVSDYSNNFVGVMIESAGSKFTACTINSE